MTRHRYVGFLLLFCSAVAAASESTGLADRAAAAFQGQDWPQVEKLYGELLADPAQRGMAAFRIGPARLYLGRVDEARVALDQAEKEGWTPAAVAYRRACADALQGRPSAAVEQLEKAVAAGFSQVALLDNEPLLAGLRGEPEFAKVKESLARQATPCRYDPRYRAFDFWLGEWDVRPSGAPATAPAGENILTLEYEGCVVIEHWKGQGGLTGSSFNIFDASRNAWFQTWVDSSGALHEYRGNPDADGNMIFVGETPGGPGQPARIPTKLSFFRLGPDSLRQFSEISVDGGKTWTTAYDLIYKRRLKR
jgi:hypothetical protein